jgi:VWFA-related protein
VTLIATVLLAQERFEDRVQVTEVQVPVRVLVKGDPVRGLTRDDFELFEGKVKREILGFEVRDLTPLRAAPVEQGDSAITTTEAGRRLLILVDFSFSGRQRLANALREIRESLEFQLHPNDRVAVGTWGYVSGLNLLVGFTGDREKIELALDAVEAMLDAKRKRQLEALSRLHNLRFGGEDALGGSTFRVLSEELSPASALAILSGPVVYDEAEDDGVRVEEQRTIFSPIRVRVDVDVREPVNTAQDVNVAAGDVGSIRALGLSIAELGYLLRDVALRKDIILLSEGFSGNLLTSAYSTFYLEKAHRALRDSGWTLHAIDVGGLPGIDEPTFSSNSLLVMSNATGGDLIENTNNFSDATGRLLRRTEVVYVLSFQPLPESEESEFRKVKVKLTKKIKGARIEHRPGYYTDREMKSREVFERRADTTSWLLSNLEAQDLEVGVFAETSTDPGGGSRTDLVVEVDGRSLLGARTRRPSRLAARILVLDPDQVARELLMAETEIKWDRDEDLLSKGGVRFAGDLGLPPGDFQLRVLVRSHRGGEVFLGTYPLRIGEPALEEPALGPPPRERPESAWITVATERRSAYFR